MRPNIEELEVLIRTRVCAVCKDRTGEGVCGLEGVERCSLFELFPLVAEAVLATDGEEIGPYIEAIRENVCSVCVDQALDGTCWRREQARCALDAYMVPIIEAIEEATGKALKR